MAVKFFFVKGWIGNAVDGTENDTIFDEDLSNVENIVTNCDGDCLESYDEEFYELFGVSECEPDFEGYY